MKKSIKLILSCLLISICCFSVVSCNDIKDSNTNYNIECEINNSLKKHGHNNFYFDINTNTILSKEEKDKNFTIENYCYITNRIRKEIKEEIGEDVKVKVELKDGDKTIIIIDGSIQ